ncbi:LysR family transcriptional regulator [Ketogulonicigenium robustum]|uniref:LysR family transcriptional regulator n=1 Tax=Ketogulonicigenium robustum TaxID=92947 RepID=A0A1W6NZR4_9RHOB|nr:LysR family transcriptional regulator [Ketogulonicigenium robustum]ARO14497.1 LysR family transcriptional regulator [Ketogulonicigenium robustum]
MNWDDARIFLAVARHGQMLGAAKALGLNHATVARRLGALERALGNTLFQRRTNGSALTAEGEAFLRHAEAMESATLAATAAVGGDVEGTVRVGAPDGFGVAYLAPRLGDLLAQHPGLRIELVPVPRAFSLSRREADIAVTLERPREGRLIARKLTDYRLGLYAARSYVARHGLPATPDDLLAHPLVGYVDDLIYTSSLDYTAAFLKNWRTTLAISSAMGQTEAVRAGAGIGVLHRFMARDDAGLVAVLPEHIVTRSYWTVVHEDLRNLRRVALVANFLSTIVQRDKAIF